MRSTLHECQEYFRGMLGVHQENVRSTLGKCQEYKRIISVVLYNSLGVINTLTISCVREVVSINAPLVVSFAL